MAELDSEDSSDGALVIDEPNYDYNIIEISDDSDVEIIKSDDGVKDVSASLSLSNSLTKIGLTCKVCSRIFSTNNDLLNHIRKFKGRVGGCMSMTNVKFTTNTTTSTTANTNITTKRKNAEDLAPQRFIKKKRGRPPKIHTVIQQSAPRAVPLIPPLIPITYQSKVTCHQPVLPIIPTNNLSSLRQLLIDDIEPENRCGTCGQVFRHNIGLICHLNSEHNVSCNKVINGGGESQSKLGEKKRNVKKNVQENKQIENNEPISDTINLTLLPDFKKDSLLNRMKSYVYSANKDQVICILCNIKFRNTKRALAHVEDKHIMEKIECGYCNMKFVYELKLRSHMAKRHKVIGVYKCDKCSKLINKEECESHSEKCKEKVNPVQIKKEDDNNLST